MPPQWSATKARKVLRALKRLGWVELRQRGSHVRLERDGERITWAWHDGVEIGPRALAELAKVTGLTPEDL